MEPWEALDIDDSDLSSFLRPCKRHLTSHAAANSPPHLPIPRSSPQTLISPPSQNLSPNRLIPGPAGAVQAAIMQRRAINRHSYSEDAADYVSTQEFVRRVLQNGDINDDHDFNSNAWMSALDWLRHQGADPLFVDPYADCLVSPNTSMATDQGTHPYRLATKFIDDKLLWTVSHNDELRQVVLLTDGMDTRPYRLSWPPSTLIFDISPENVFQAAAEKLEGDISLSHQMILWSVEECLAVIDLNLKDIPLLLNSGNLVIVARHEKFRIFYCCIYYYEPS